MWWQRSRALAYPFVLITAISAAWAPATASDRITKYGIRISADKRIDFGKFKTYVWTPRPDILETLGDPAVTTAVERELGILGLSKVESGPSDSLVGSSTVGRTDVNVKAKSTGRYRVRPQYPVGTLVIVLLDPRSRRELFRARADIPLETPSTLTATVDDVVARMFAKYPTRDSNAKPER